METRVFRPVMMSARPRALHSFRLWLVPSQINHYELLDEGPPVEIYRTGAQFETPLLLDSSHQKLEDLGKDVELPTFDELLKHDGRYLVLQSQMQHEEHRLLPPRCTKKYLPPYSRPQTGIITRPEHRLLHEDSYFRDPGHDGNATESSGTVKSCSVNSLVSDDSKLTGDTSAFPNEILGRHKSSSTKPSYNMEPDLNCLALSSLVPSEGPRLWEISGLTFQGPVEKQLQQGVQLDMVHHASGGTQQNEGPRSHQLDSLQKNDPKQNRSKERPRKRRAREKDNDDNDEDEDDDGSGSDDTYQRGCKVWFGCPFCKHDPEKYKGFRSSKTKKCRHPDGIAYKYLKEHLHRFHSGKTAKSCIYCKHKWVNLDDYEAELSEHLQTPCVSAEKRRRFRDQMTAEQERAIKGYIKPQNDTEGWKRMYKALFPETDDALIPNPLYDFYSVLPGSQVTPQLGETPQVTEMDDIQTGNALQGANWQLNLMANPLSPTFPTTGSEATIAHSAHNYKIGESCLGFSERNAVSYCSASAVTAMGIPSPTHTYSPSQPAFNIHPSHYASGGHPFPLVTERPRVSIGESQMPVSPTASLGDLSYACTVVASADDDVADRLINHFLSQHHSG